MKNYLWNFSCLTIYIRNNPKQTIMKPIKCILFVLLFLVVLSLKACGNSREEMALMDQNPISEMNLAEMEEQIMESNYEDAVHKSAMPSATVQFVPPKTAIDFFTSKAADGTLDGDKKFIRTANLRFSVVDVISATHAIEDIVIAQKGFIINSSLTNETNYTTETRVTKGSIQVKTHNRLSGNLKVRVHHSLLDATLREIAPLAEHIEYRHVNADEVTFRIMANNLEAARKKDKSARIKNISGAGKGHKLDDLLSAEESIDNARRDADAAAVAKAEMYDEIEYSTITISLWQAPTVTSTMKLRAADVLEYRQGFFAGVGDAIVDGWNGLLEVVEDLFSIWPILLIIGGIVYAIIYFRKKKKQQATKE